MTASFSDYGLRALFHQLAEGDHTAFTELFYYYNARLYPFVLKKVKQPAIAEELVQDIFLKLWTNREGMAGMDNPEGYLYRMAANRVLDYFKKMAREAKLTVQAGEVKSENTILSAIDLRQVEQAVADAVRRLPGQRQRIYQLREQGLSYAEIAEMLGLSANTVKNQLVEASRFIRHYLRQRGISTVAFLHFCLLAEKIFSLQ